MTTKFIENTNSKIVRPANIDISELLDKPPAKVYSVQYDEGGFYLKIKSDIFEISEPLGSTEKDADHILAPYNKLGEPSGALLTGLKGAGKSYLAKLTCNKAIVDLGLPVVCVEDPHYGSTFSGFIERLGDCVLFFDEFAKTYGKGYRGESLYASSDLTGGDPQEALLSLFDGLSNNKRIVIITENNVRNINEGIIGRPSRVRYFYHFSRVKSDVIYDYLEKEEVDEVTAKEIIQLSKTYFGFNFDSLKALVTESKIGIGSLAESAKFLNLGRTLNTYFKIVRVLNLKDNLRYVPAFAKTLNGNQVASKGVVEIPVDKIKTSNKASQGTIVAYFSPTEDFEGEDTSGNLIFTSDKWKIILKEISIDEMHKLNKKRGDGHEGKKIVSIKEVE